MFELWCRWRLHDAAGNGRLPRALCNRDRPVWIRAESLDDLRGRYGKQDHVLELYLDLCQCVPSLSWQIVALFLYRPGRLKRCLLVDSHHAGDYTWEDEYQGHKTRWPLTAEDQKSDVYNHLASITSPLLLMHGEDGE